MDLLSADRELTRDSYYAATAERQHSYPPLQGAQHCDVAVVGGGLAGLSAALELAERGFSVTLLEARELGFGASGRNGGQAIHGLACDQSTIEAQLGLDDARRVWDMSIEALELLRQRIARHAIDCDWRDGYLGLATNPRKGRELLDWAERMERVYGYAQQPIAPAQLPQWIASERFHSGVFDRRSGHLHPLKYTLGLARAAAAAGVRLHEQSPVQSLQPGPTVRLHTPQGELQRTTCAAGRQRLPAGTGAAAGAAHHAGGHLYRLHRKAARCAGRPADPFARGRVRYQLRARLLPHHQRPAHAVWRPGQLQHRRAGQPGRQHAAGAWWAPSRSWRRPRIEYAWGGFVDISMNRAPDFGRLPTAGGYAANMYYLQGFSGHGLALTGLAGKLVAEAIAGDASRLDVFARLRHRPFPGGRLLRTPALVLGMAWYRLRDLVA